MESKVILLDQDGVVADFERGFLACWQERFPNRPHIALDQRTTFYPRDQYPQEFRDDIAQLVAEEGFYLNLPPIEGAIIGVNQMIDSGHKVFICTSPLLAYIYCVPEKYSWVERYFGVEMVKNIIVAKDKTLIHGDFLVDDRPEISGVTHATWEHIVFDQPFNRHVLNRRIQWDNWQSILTQPTE